MDNYDSQVESPKKRHPLEEAREALPPVSPPSITVQPPKRGTGLTIWLVVSAILVLGGIVALQWLQSQVAANPAAGLILTPTLFSIVFTSFLLYGISLVGIWRLKRWGVYGFVAVVVFAELFGFLTTPPQFRSLGGALSELIVPGIQLLTLYWLVAKRWREFT